MQSLDSCAMRGTTSSESERPERSKLCMHGPFLRNTNNPKLEGIAETEHGSWWDDSFVRGNAAY